MAKKKKPTLKPVARGFATTSVPKKVIPEEEDPLALEDDILETTSSVQNADADGPDGKPDDSENDNDRNMLQSIVEKLQEKTEKEIARTIKTIEYDRRFSKNLARVDIDRAIRDQILDLILGSQHPGDVAQQRPDEAEDKLIARIGITYGVLMRLGFSEERVIDCLNLIPGVDLDEAFDWLYLHCSEYELENDERTLELPLTPRTPRTPESSSMPATPVPSKNLLPIDIRHSSTPVASLSGKYSHLKSDSGSETDGSLEDPNLEYVMLKMKISDLIGAGQWRSGTRADELIVGLEARLAEVKKHYFFDEKDAEAEFRLKRREADKSELHAQLRGLAMPPKLPTGLEINDRQLRDDPPQQVGRNTDVFDIDDSPGGLLDILEPMPTSETSAMGTIVNVVDLGSPKLWTGRTPKVVLQEFISKTDRYAAVSYQDISGHSRAKRASVSVRWGSGKNGNWEMLDVACHSITQAEQYAATVALHSLIRPPTLGFASGGASSGTSPTSFRLLPAVFRDVWNDLEARRKDREDQTNRRVWGMLKDIVGKKLANDSKHNAKRAKPTVAPDNLPTFKVFQPRDWTADQLLAAFLARQASPAYQHMLAQRNTLPIAHYRKDIIETLEISQILVLSGETGCGKSTQLPSFILEDQLSRGRPCKILVTEPRRISAISLAQRVSRELGDPPGAVGTLSSLVGYSIRLESHTTRNTRLTFVTNGIALRMLEGGTGQGGQGTAFDEITHIVIDEVHERSIESDFLLIVLKSLLAQRRDLKVVLMSATVDAEKISDFFGGCPTLQVPGRTFPVDVRYLEDAIELTQWSISESSPFARRKNDKFYRNDKHRQEWSEDQTVGGDDDDDVTQTPVKLEQRYSPATLSTVNLLDERLIPYDLIVGLLERVCFSDHSYIHFSAAILVFMPGLGEIRRLNDMLLDHPLFSETAAFRIYPLHSMISNENQSAAFDIPPVDVRKIVIATNIAETGITIPDITCVIDSGKHREMRFDEKRQISRLVETYIARSNAAQRRGRAGRVQPGLCFHLFTKVRHDTQMAEHALPEMMRLSLSDLSLRIKIMKVKLGSSIEDVLSRAMDPPSSINIQRAVSALVEVQALTTNEEITPMGRLLSKLPTDVHLGKFLLIAALFRCLDPALTIAAALNSKSPFVSPFGFEEEADRAKQSFKFDNSDFLTIHNAFASWRRASENPSFLRKFCRQNYLSHQNLQQIEELRQQFLGYLIDSSFITVDHSFVKELSRSRYSKGRTRFVTVPAEYDRNSGENSFLLNAALCAGLYPKLLTIDPQGGQQMRTLSNSQPAAFHPSSVNFGKKSSSFGVNHLCYFTIMQSKRLYAWETGPVDDVAILLLCGDAEFKLNSDSVFIDRKIKYRLEPKTNVAVKHLRSRLALNLALEFKGKALTPAQMEWNDLALKLLGKAKLEERPAQTIVLH